MYALWNAQPRQRGSSLLFFLINEYILCLQVLKRYKRELGILSSNMKINMDLNDLQAFITAQHVYRS